MGFVYNLHCDSCDLALRNLVIGLEPGGSTMALIQDRQTGEIRQISVTKDEVSRHAEIAEFASEADWLAAMSSFIESQITQTERNIAPHDAICPKCRTSMRVESVGIA